MALVAYRPPVRLILSLGLLLTAASASAQEGTIAGTDTGTDTGTVAGADTDTGTETDTGAGTGADTDTVADPGTDTAPPLPPKVAVVVAGDPDESVLKTASEIEQECARAGLSIPADPALRAALRGEPDSEEDGLDGLRSIRRSLGVDPRKDLASYKRLGTITGADALVVLRREGTIKIEVFDAAASQFYEGALDFDGTTPEERAHYIERRAETAQTRWLQDPSPPDAAGAQVDATGKPTDEPEKKRWIKKAWPYFVVGALLAAGVTYLIVDGRRTNDPGPPLLRFRPGDE
ncbi:MAG: hypothetical protein OES69_09595 [Myxococcales bacterium]|nr:hypothetical protein [Myxococcales bacterium]MDH3844179.1 hypothetical protein [Myxococcales bacterium]